MLLELAMGRSHREAARAAGIGVSTLKRRLAVPGYKERVAKMRGELLELAGGRLAGLAARAVEVLAELAEDVSAPPATRLAAAKSILEGARTYHDSVAVAARVAALERQREAEEGGYAVIQYSGFKEGEEAEDGH